MKIHESRQGYTSGILLIMSSMLRTEVVSLPAVIGESTVKGITGTITIIHIFFFPTVPVLGLKTAYSTAEETGSSLELKGEYATKER